MIPTYVFLMQPYKLDHAEKLREIIFDSLNNAGFIVKRADKESSDAGFLLQYRIDEYIKKSDICIADLTIPRNENVLLEVGAALALHIPVVIISNKLLPSNIRGNIYVDLNPEDLSKTDKIETFLQDLKNRIVEAKSLIGHSPWENFIAHGYPDREGVDFDLIIRRTERRINILTTNLGYVVGQKLFSKEYPNGKTMLESLMTELPKKQNSGFKTSILALDPDSNFTNERADTLNRSRRDFREEMRKNLDMLTKKTLELKNVNIDVKIYSEYPLQMTFFFDDVIVNSVVAASISSRFCVTYVHNLSNRSSRNTFEKHFDELWGRSRPYVPSSHNPHNYDE